MKASESGDRLAGQTEAQAASPGRHVRRYYPSLKRAFDICFSIVGLTVFAPVFVAIALIIKCTDHGPILFRQRRVGRKGVGFEILKFRTMVVDAEKVGPSVTQDRDPRITGIGRMLRRTKFDELPQLWNVLVGEMSFVGPRPEVPRYVERYTVEQRRILEETPGITDLATLVFRDEESLLRNAKDVEGFYMQHCVPRKLQLNLQYANRANLLEDVLIISETLCPYWLGVACGYVLALGISLLLAYELRFDFKVPEGEYESMKRLGLFIIPLQAGILVWRKQLVGLLSYFDVAEMRQLASGLGLAALIQLTIWFCTQGRWMPARSIIVIDAVIAITLLAGTRTFLKHLRETQRPSRSRQSGGAGVKAIGIVGAGELGAWLARQINDESGGHRKVMAFFDDDPDKWNLELCGVPVVGMPECALNGAWVDKLDEVILAIPRAKQERQTQIIALLTSANIHVRTVPVLEELLSK